MPVSKAVIEDVDDLVQLINSAYRGEASKKGWTTEADLLQGELRTDAPMLADIIAKPQAVILKYTNDEGTITGSVFLEKQERGLYLGMLSVSPLQQATGVGKQLMKAAEQYAKEKWCSFIFMNVISIRHELIKYMDGKHMYKPCLYLKVLKATRHEKDHPCFSFLPSHEIFYSTGYERQNRKDLP